MKTTCPVVADFCHTEITNPSHPVLEGCEGFFYRLQACSELAELTPALILSNSEEG
jgi:hypothetical protein